MIVSGIILKNVHDGHIINGLRASWSREFRGIALAMIFLRSGLELDLGVGFSYFICLCFLLIIAFASFHMFAWLSHILTSSIASSICTFS